MTTKLMALEPSKSFMFHYVSSKQELFLCVYDYFISDTILKQIEEYIDELRKVFNVIDHE